jgi:phosphoglycolate phosphatase
VGDGARTCVFRALPANKRTPLMIDCCLELFLEDYAQHWNIYTKPYPGIYELLNVLMHRNFKMAVLSNKPHAFTEKCVEAFFPLWKFQAVFGQTEIFPKKPDPSMALNISKRLNIPPHKILFIGDTHVDMKTAIRAGMIPVGVLWGFRSMDELIQNGAKSVVKTPKEIIPIISEL